MGKVSFLPELNSKPRKVDGLYAIMIRITKDRKIKRVSTGLFVKKSDWNCDKKEVRKLNKDSEIMNAFLQKKINEISIENINSQVRNKNLSINALQKKMKGDAGGGDFYEYAEKLISQKSNSGTRRVYETIVNKLKQFRRSLDFSDIDRSFLSEYEKFLKETMKNNTNTVHKNMSTVRTIYYQAIKDDMIEGRNNPFLFVSLKKQRGKRSKLTFAEMKMIENVELPEGSVIFHARNFFVMQYYLLGMRVADMLMMRWENVVDNRIDYVASKTQKPMSVKIHTRAQAILDYYKKAKPKRNEYIFPFATKYVFRDHDEYRRHIESKTSQVNNKLKEIAKKLGIEKAISTHVSRHSFAENARIKSGNNIYAISKALGHSNISITENYFSQGTRADTDRITKVLFGSD